MVASSGIDRVLLNRSVPNECPPILPVHGAKMKLETGLNSGEAELYYPGEQKDLFPRGLYLLTAKRPWELSSLPVSLSCRRAWP